MKAHEFQAARRELGMTQIELGQALEIGSAERSIRRYETATTSIPGPVAVAVRLMLRDERRRAKRRKPKA